MYLNGFKFIKRALVTAFLVTVSVSTNALGSKKAFEGPYAGLDLGGAWASSTYNTDSGCGDLTSNAVFCNVSPDPSAINGVAVADSGSGTLNFNGFNANAHLGYNFLSVKNIILGGEAEFGSLNLKKTQNAQGLFPFTFLGNQYLLSDTVSTTWLATIRARLGMLIKPQFLLYTTGGVAFTDLHVSASYNDNAIDITFPGGSGHASQSKAQTGWTVGGGGEWQFSDFYSIKLEYLYVDFGSLDVSVPVSNTSEFTQTMQVNANLKAHVVRVGINYRL